ncbi:beta-ketoacyl synthase N-terminal-like domain-containing protein [Streptomyces sp. NPDC101165]|uniref:beta-ketoacyl synthase N-terminal-like domain-containing protein n=1 Tax=Streptomyces sp. NPDC101165 TaxID=3366119 RepID=UPI003803606C
MMLRQTTAAGQEAAALDADALYVTGWGVVSPLGTGAEEFAVAFTEERDALVDVTGMYEEKLPAEQAFALPDFQAEERLGRKGTRFFDRATALALIACDEALRDTAITVTDANRADVGLVLGTTSGSVKSTSDFSRETITQDRPYLVNPVLFPNAVMNCAAGQAAIWFGLKGVNTTIAGGRMAQLAALRYAARSLSWGDVDTLLVGAVEEFSPHSAWLSHLADGPAPVGEGAAVFVVERGAALARTDRRPEAEILAVATGSADPEDRPSFVAAFANCVRQVLARAGVAAQDLWALSPGSGPAAQARAAHREPEVEHEVLALVLGDTDGPDAPVRLPVTRLVGDCGAAQGGMQLAAVLAHHRRSAALDGRPALITSCTADGAFGATVVRGWQR